MRERASIGTTSAIALIMCIGCGVSSTTTSPSSASNALFSGIGTLTGIGYVASSTVGPAPGGTQRYYLSYSYAQNLEIVAVDEAGRITVYPSPVSGEGAPHGVTIGSDANIYFGTSPHAHILRLNTTSDQLEDVGTIATEQYIWGLTTGSDSKIYGCTYPSAKLIRYNPKTSLFEDLGRMDASELYARACVADQSGFVYVGIGSTTSNIAAYEIATGRHREIIPTAYLTAGFGQLVTDSEGKVHGRVGSQWFSLSGWSATPEHSVPLQQPNNIFADGTSISISGATVQLKSPAVNSTTLPYTYRGNALPISRLGFGPDGNLYASSALPFYLFKQGSSGFSNIGQLGDGEGYSFLPLNGRILIGAYASIAPLLSYDVSREAASSPPNPTAINYPGENTSWRPLSMIQGNDGYVYIASMPGYGYTSSPLTRLDPESSSVTSINVLPNQSTTSVAASNGSVVMGTSISGGPGTISSANQAMIIVLGPDGKLAYQIAPIKGASRIANLITLPNNNIVGISDKTPFIFDPETHSLKSKSSLPESPLDSSLMLGPDGALWGLTANTIFRIDPDTLTSESISSPVPIAAGIAMDDNYLYFGSNSTIYEFNWKSRSLN
jgi:streptogramin lyase